jgi:hypothetical protein
MLKPPLKTLLKSVQKRARGRLNEPLYTPSFDHVGKTMSFSLERVFGATFRNQIP